jgi:hypothetical protein
LAERNCPGSWDSSGSESKKQDLGVPPKGGDEIPPLFFGG